MADIFISYKREDCERVKPLAIALEALGWSVFWDPNIQPGHTFDDLIEAELDRAKAVVVAWSERSVRSEWVRAEAQRAKERDILIPIQLDATKPPLAFTLIQSAPFSDWTGNPNHEGYRLLLTRIEALAGKPTRLTEIQEHDRLEREAREVWNDIKTTGNPAVVARFASLYPTTGAAAEAKQKLSARLGWRWRKHLHRWQVYFSVVLSVLSAIGLEHFYRMPLKYNLPLSLLAFIVALYVFKFFRYVFGFNTIKQPTP